MALTRARIVAGDRGFGREVMTAVGQAVARNAPAERILKDIREMRALVAREKPAASVFDLKLAPGGFVDIEFAAQALQLLHGGSRPGIVRSNTGDALAALSTAGLIAPEAARALLDAWRLQSGLAQLLAVSGDVPFKVEAARPPFCRKLAAVAGLPDFRALEGALKSAQAGAHDAMRAVLGG
jgi:glutamate-ammonia-ligase adenylyltransferase